MKHKTLNEKSQEPKPKIPAQFSLTPTLHLSTRIFSPGPDGCWSPLPPAWCRAVILHEKPSQKDHKLCSSTCSGTRQLSAQRPASSPRPSWPGPATHGPAPPHPTPPGPRPVRPCPTWALPGPAPLAFRGLPYTPAGCKEQAAGRSLLRKPSAPGWEKGRGLSGALGTMRPLRSAGSFPEAEARGAGQGRSGVRGG